MNKVKGSLQAIGHYSLVKSFDKLIFCSGQIAIKPKTNTLSGKTIEEQTRQVLKNVQTILQNEGSSISKILKVTVFLKNISDFEKFNNVYAKILGDNKPARSTIETSNLPKQALIEIDVIAHK